MFFKCLSESWPVVETGFKKVLPVVCYGSPSKIVVFHYRSSLPKTVLLYHMLLHQKPCFLVIAALYRKPFHTFWGNRLTHFSGSMCSFSGNVFCLISTALNVDGSVAKISFSRLEDEHKINKKFRISSANKA